MRIAIITLQLHTNCGGVLQAYALERVLEDMGHTVEIVRTDEVVPVPKGLRAIWKYSVRSLRRMLGQKDIEVRREERINAEFPEVGKNYIEFFGKYLSIRDIHSFGDIRPCEYDALVVGSDQVWRPLYNPYLLDSYLDFARGWNVRRVAYAVSFGTSDWEYSSPETKKAAELACLFDALSFREESGCRLCREHLGLEPVVTLDPTLLLTAEDWTGLLQETDDGWGADSGAGKPGGTMPAADKCDGSDMCDAADVSARGCRIFEYILDHKEKSVLESLESSMCLEYGAENRAAEASISRFPESDPRGSGPVANRVQSSPLTWLRRLYEADFVITDSFHACVFSIMFHKKFAVLKNAGRGSSRIPDLLALVGLSYSAAPDDGQTAKKGLVVNDGDAACEMTVADSGRGNCILYDNLNCYTDWEAVDARLDELRKSSLNYLRTNLQ